MASSVAHGCICMMTATSPANRTCNVGLHHAFLILDIYIIVRWHLSKQGIHWPVTSELIEVKLTDQVQAFQLDCELNFFPLPVIRALLFGTDASTGLKVNQLFLYINVLHCLFFLIVFIDLLCTACLRLLNSEDQTMKTESVTNLKKNKTKILIHISGLAKSGF